MEVVRYRTDHGAFMALVEEGRKWISAIMIDASGIRVAKVPLADRKYMEPVNYNLPKAKRKFRAAGRRFGMTKAAKQMLRG